MSFNVWALYIATFLWFIPCQKLNCPPTEIWTITLKNIDLTTRLESVQDGIHGNLLLFGSNRKENISLGQTTEGRISAFIPDSGTLLWNTTLPFVPTRLQCYNRRISGDRGIVDCVATGNTDIASFNASNGHILWVQTSEKELFDINVIEMSCSSSVSRIIYAEEYVGNSVFLTAIESETGLKMASVETPCGSAPFLIHSWTKRNSVLLLCQRNKLTNMWMLPTDVLCSTNPTPVMFIKTTFFHLYEIEDMDSSPRVKILPSGDLLLGSSSSVILLSPDEDSFSVEWKVVFNHSNVVGMVIGNFSSSYESMVVVQLEDLNFNTELCLLNLTNGEKIASVLIPEEKPKSMLLVTGELSMNNIDSVLVGTEKRNNPRKKNKLIPLILDSYVERLDIQPSTISYSLVSFHTTIKISKVLDALSIPSQTTVVESKLGPLLLLSSPSLNGALTVKSFMLNNSTSNSCTS